MTSHTARSTATTPPRSPVRATSSDFELKARNTTAGKRSIVSEASWQRTVLDLFRVHGWRCWHDTTAWRSDPGWPDLVCTHRAHGLVFLELKREGGRVSAAQAGWHADLAAAGYPVHVLRPSDWDRAMALAKGETR